jgi:glutathione synthase/RimK-type ligase-like ATP-grasp enzyme
MISALNLKVFNNPTLEDQANRKTYQLACASECGLQIPHTLVTNDGEALKRFVERSPEGVIFKPFLSPEGAFCVTKDLLAEHLSRLDLLANAPVIFQERVPPYKDVRVTVVGQKLFAAECQSPLLDWRTDLNIKWNAHPLSSECESAILRLVSRLGLDFGSLDFRMRPTGDYIFFEINPNGQFLFLEVDDAELPVSAAIADFLFAAKHVHDLT